MTAMTPPGRRASLDGFVVTLLVMALVAVGIIAADWLILPPPAATRLIVLSLGTLWGVAGLSTATWSRLDNRILIPLVCVAAALVLATAVYAFVANKPGLGVTYLVMTVALSLAATRNRLFLGGAYGALRACVWIGAFWQLSNLVLGPDMRSLIATSPAIALQVALALAIIVNLVLVLRGDRSWLLLPPAAERKTLMARLILPVTILPVGIGYLAVVAMRLNVLSRSVGFLINLEFAGAALFLLGVWTMRSLRREQRSREELASALEVSSVIVRARDGVIRHWPGGCETLYGWTADEAAGRIADDLLATEFPVSRAAAEAALERDGEWTGEVRRATRSGEGRWVALRWTLMQEFGPRNLAQVVETQNDITGLKLAHSALRDSEERLAQAVATYELAISTLDVTGGVTTYSPQWEIIAGLPPGALGESTEAWLRLIMHEDLTEIGAAFFEAVSTRKPRRTHTYRIRRPDGEIRYLREVTLYAYEDDGAVRGITSIAMDVTEQHRAQSELRARSERLMEMHSMLAHISRLSAMGEMAAALAHELNQPLTAVGNSVGAIEILLRGEGKPFDEQMRARLTRAAAQAHGQAVRAGEIIRRLREFLGRGEADTSEVNLAVLVDDAMALALPNPAAARVQTKIDIPEAARRVLVDRLQIEQVMVNLIRNALEAMRSQDRPRRLTVLASTRGGMAEVSVRDTGPGVPPEVVEKLFAPFQSTKSDGMGVGLSICRRIIEAHGGAMWLAPGDTGGADFRFTLPLFPGDGSSAPT